MTMFIKQTIGLLVSSNMNIKQFLKPLHLVCDTCKETKTITEDAVCEIDTENIESFGPISVEYILKRYINSQDSFQCNHDLDNVSVDNKGRLVIFSFSNPITFNIQERIMLWGKIWEYKAHVEESVKKQENMTYFKNGKLMIFQDNNKALNSAAFGTHYNVKILALIVTHGEEHEVINSSNLIYNSKVQLKLHKKYLSVVNPEAGKEKVKKIKEYEINRNKQEERRVYKRKIQNESKASYWLIKKETRSEIKQQRRS
jgi:hypothetical protein